MAVRKKKTAARKARAVDIQLPATLKEFRRDVGKQLGRVEKEIEKTAATARRRATKLLREASHTLGRYEQQGEQAWKKLSGTARRDAEKVVHQLEKFFAGTPKKRVKKVAKKR